VKIIQRMAAVLVLMVSASVAQADLIDIGDSAIDTSTGLKWLKLSFLVGYSYDQVAGGALDYTTSGWRYATQFEVVDLFTQYIGPQNDGYTNWSSGPNAVSSLYFDDAYNLVIKLGMNLAFNDSRATINLDQPGLHQISVTGMFNDELTGDSRQGFAEATAVITDDSGANCYLVSVPCGRWGVTTDFIPADNNSQVRSSFLVRRVPEPGTFALLMLGLLGMGLSRRKKV